jgi:hypothetical protein
MLPATPPPPPAPYKKRSTRIPDFSEVLFEKEPGPALRYAEKNILVTEIKKHTDATRSSFAAIFKQIDHQATFSFHQYPKSTILGTIAVIGQFWTYLEYHKTDQRPSPSLSEKEDPTYRDTTPQLPSLLRREYPPIRRLQGKEGCFRLLTPESDKGLMLVRKRLEHLHGA